jgi:hypothetical protein
MVIICIEFGNKLSSSIKCGKFLGQLRDDQLFKEDSVPWSYARSRARVCVGMAIIII